MSSRSQRSVAVAADPTARLLVLAGSLWCVVVLAAAALTAVRPTIEVGGFVFLAIIPVVVGLASLLLPSRIIQAWLWLVCAAVIALVATNLIVTGFGFFLFPAAFLYAIAFGRVVSDGSTPPRFSRMMVLGGSLWGIALLALIAIAVAGPGDGGFLVGLMLPFLLALASLKLPDPRLQPPVWLGCAILVVPVAMITIFSGVGFFLLPVALLYAVAFGRATFYF